MGLIDRAINIPDKAYRDSRKHYWVQKKTDTLLQAKDAIKFLMACNLGCKRADEMGEEAIKEIDRVLGV